MSIEIDFPEKILRKIEEISKSEDTLPEEIVNEAMIEYLKIADPETKAELYKNLCEKYLNDAEELIKRLK